jgi:hypothetical protein
MGAVAVGYKVADLTWRPGAGLGKNLGRRFSCHGQCALETRGHYDVVLALLQSRRVISGLIAEVSEFGIFFPHGRAVWPLKLKIIAM